MELDGLFTSTKWEILSLIAREPRNPLMLAEQLGTSIANVSQQLRLLEVAGLVRKEKVSNRERGKPRTVYSLAGDLFYMVILSKDRQEKRLTPLTAALKGQFERLTREKGK